MTKQKAHPRPDDIVVLRVNNPKDGHVAPTSEEGMVRFRQTPGQVHCCEAGERLTPASDPPCSLLSARLGRRSSPAQRRSSASRLPPRPGEAARSCRGGNPP